jgi:MFS family permease
VVKSIIHLAPDMLALSIVVFAGMGLLMPIVKLYAMEQLGMSETKFGMMLAPVAATLGLLALPFGRLADRIGKLVSVSYGLLVCAIAMWLIAILRSVVVASIAATVIGVGFAVSFPAWMAVVSQAAPSERRGQVMGAVGMAQGFGAIIGTAIGPLIYSTDWLSLPRLGVMHCNLPFYLSALLISAGTVMAFTWISRLRASETSGRTIQISERRAIITAALIAGMIICGWVVIRYTRPVVPDRVAWLWVQAAVHGDAKRAERFTLPSFERTDDTERTASEMAADIFSRWSIEEKAYYTPPSHPRYSDNGHKAEVSVVFHFPDRSKAKRVIVLQKQPSGEWKVAE